MARFHADDAKNYGGQGGGGFFGLEDDGDTARVRFCYESIDDVEGFSVHHVKVGKADNGSDIFRNVNCLREYNQPIDDCPFCREGMPVQAKLYIPVYDMDNDVIKTWERGKKFFDKISGIVSKYPNTVTRVFEIQRHGQKRDMSTTYEIMLDDDKTEETGYDPELRVEDLGELPNILGSIVLDKTADDMEYFLEEGQFPPTEGEESDEDERPARRGSNRGDRGDRRTPSNRGGKGRSF